MKPVQLKKEKKTTTQQKPQHTQIHPLSLKHMDGIQHRSQRHRIMRWTRPLRSSSPAVTPRCHRAEPLPK